MTAPPSPDESPDLSRQPKREAAEEAAEFESLGDDIWGEYGERLRRLAQSRLPDRLSKRVGAEDVVQSVCRTFFRRLRGNKLQLDDAEGLWNLLCVITLNKVRSKVRYHSRQRRAVQREQSLEFADLSGEPSGSSDEAQAFVEQLQELLEELDEECRCIVQLKLEEKTHDEIAVELGLSERTVRRRLSDVRSRWKQKLFTQDP